MAGDTRNGFSSPSSAAAPVRIVAQKTDMKMVIKCSQLPFWDVILENYHKAGLWTTSKWEPHRYRKRDAKQIASLKCLPGNQAGKLFLSGEELSVKVDQNVVNIIEGDAIHGGVRQDETDTPAGTGHTALPQPESCKYRRVRIHHIGVRR